ncbi:VWA domain-containing protein [bacterium]|nr:VWA domain-containing protein [bacterium]
MSFVYASFLWLLLPLGVYLFQRKRKQTLQQNLRWVALALLIIAVARPVIVQSPSKQTLPAHSIVIALDLSASMKAEDIKPNRMKASSETIQTFLEHNRYDQIALIGFTINPLLLSPLTTDHALVSMALDTMKSEYILTKGTDLKKLLEKVAKFPDHEKKLILFSDGGDELIEEALITFAQDQNIKILAVAMATEQGASVTTKDGTLLKDKEGHIVVSKFNRGVQALAEQSGGILITFNSPKDTAQKIESWIDKQKVLKEGLERETHNYVELFFIPTFLAWVLLFLSATRFSLKVVALLALLNINVQAQELYRSSTKSTGYLDNYHLTQAYKSYEKQDYNSSIEELRKIETPTLESQLTLAHTYYKLEQYKQAKSILKTIKTTHSKVKQQLLYELGNCEAKLAYYDKAKNYYIQALQLGEDEDALHNLNVVIFQQNKNSSKVGFTNPGSPESSNSSNDNVESEEKTASKQEEQTGSSGGDGSQKSKTSTVKVVQSSEASSSKREMSSKAYDLINEGYIREEKPW